MQIKNLFYAPDHSNQTNSMFFLFIYKLIYKIPKDNLLCYSTGEGGTGKTIIIDEI
jgi:hypothetical protein